jgi:hypothetical protein
MGAGFGKVTKVRQVFESAETAGWINM